MGSRYHRSNIVPLCSAIVFLSTLLAVVCVLDLAVSRAIAAPTLGSLGRPPLPYIPSQHRRSTHDEGSHPRFHRRQSTPTSDEPNPINNISARTVKLTPNAIYLSGVPTVLRGGSLQWFRIPPEEWEERVRKFKAAGFNLIDLYTCWRNHEPEMGVWAFDGGVDLAKFLEIAKKHDLYVYFRPGPYITNEMDAGGIPYWARALSTKRILNPTTLDGTFHLRTNDKDYIDAVARYYEKVNEVVMPYLHTRGGPVVLYAIENELDWFEGSLQRDTFAEMPDGLPERPADQKPDGGAYLAALRDIVIQTGIDVPITVCPGDGTLSATHNVPSIHPMPNQYFQLNIAEYTNHRLSTLLRSSPTYSTNTPLGITETGRDNWVLRRLLISGSDLVSQFNIFAFHQEGRMNGLGQNTDAFYGYTNDELWGQFLERSVKVGELLKPGTGVFRFPVGLYPGVLDKNAAVSSAGLMRDKFYHIRRTNLLVDALGTSLAEAGVGKRIANNGEKIEGSDYRVRIYNAGDDLGAPDPD
ncbi:hypothetical protein HK102_008247, partial [Quaeritorhiza haematococci]